MVHRASNSLGGGGGGLCCTRDPERGRGWAKGESHTGYSLFDVQTATSQTQTLLWSEPDKWSVIWPQWFRPWNAVLSFTAEVNAVGG